MLHIFSIHCTYTKLKSRKTCRQKRNFTELLVFLMDSNNMLWACVDCYFYFADWNIICDKSRAEWHICCLKANFNKHISYKSIKDRTDQGIHVYILTWKKPASDKYWVRRFEKIVKATFFKYINSVYWIHWMLTFTRVLIFNHYWFIEILIEISTLIRITCFSTF